MKLKNFIKHFFDDSPDRNIESSIAVDDLIFWFEVFSSTTSENFYIIDIAESRVRYVKSDDFFLCDHSACGTLNLGYDFYGFYKKRIHPDDLPLWKKTFIFILTYLSDYKEKQDKIEVFSCTFRLHHKFSFLTRPILQMVYHRMKPIWVNNELTYIICFIGSSTSKEVGNLRMYYKDGLSYEEFNLISKRGKLKKIESLTERERAILMLAQQGKNSEEIANILCKAHNTIRNQIKPIFSKLNVHSMQEAIEFAHYHRMLYPNQNKQMQSINIQNKRTRILLTDNL